jgi:predicted outer membrane repeat protein
LYGGAVDVAGPTLTVENTQFLANQASMSGGALFGAYISLAYCVFANNTAGARGGVFCNDDDNSSYVEITNGIFRNNSATEGGVIYTVGSIIATDVTFTNNTALLGGAVHLKGEDPTDSSEFSGCRFLANEARSSGGALTLSLPADVALLECVFRSNQAGIAGGAVNIQAGYQGKLLVEACEFSDHAVPSGSGAALVVAQNAKANVEVRETVFKSNMVRDEDVSNVITETMVVKRS